jgi:hypothetical protein
MRTRLSRNGLRPISQSRWAAYAGASAASLLAGGQCAEAAIHYSGPINVTVPGDVSGIRQVKFELDQPGDSIAFVHRSTIFWFQDQWAGFQAYGLKSGSFRGLNGLAYFYVQKLQRGDSVPAGPFNNRPISDLSGFGELAGQFSGYFVQPRVSFIGFRFNSGAGRQYGWARVKMSGYRKGNGFQVWDYAYADPGEPIQAGQTSSDEPVRPDLESLGGLAFGAVGIAAWKRWRLRSAPQRRRE